MKTSFVVTVEGIWLYNGKPATAARVEKEIRAAVKDRLEYLADRVTVKRQSTGAQSK